jgi:hypothetical protein
VSVSGLWCACVQVSAPERVCLSVCDSVSE